MQDYAISDILEETIEKIELVKSEGNIDEDIIKCIDDTVAILYKRIESLYFTPC